MLWRLMLIGTLVGCVAGPALSDDQANSSFPHGDYICTVEQKAGIAAEEQEGADPPAAFIDKHVTRFHISVTAPPASSAESAATEAREKFTLEEKSYDGPDRDPQSWQTVNAVLHSLYSGDGHIFYATGEPAFLRLDLIGEAGWLLFYHSGFEHHDRDNVKLSVRSGTCAPSKD